MSFPHYPQLEFSDCGPACLKIILKHFGKRCDLEYLRELAEVTRSGVSMGDIARAATKLGFTATGVQASVTGLQQSITLPCILHWRQDHFVVLYKIKNGQYYISDPAFGKMKFPESDFNALWKEKNYRGSALLLAPTEEFIQKQFPYTERKELNKRLKAFLHTILEKQSSKLAALAVIMLLSTGLVYIFPETMRRMIDIGVKGNNVSVLWAVLFFQVAIVFGQTLLEWMQGLFRVHFSMQVSIKMISRLLHKIVMLPIRYFDSRVQSDTLQKIDEQERIENFLSYQLVQSLFSFVLLLGLSIRLFIYDPALAVLILLMSSFSVVWTIAFFNRRKALDYYSFRVSSENRNHLTEMVQGMVAIKLNNGREAKINRWHSIRNKLYKLKLKSLNLDLYQVMGVNLIGQLKIIVVTFLCAKWVTENRFTLGEMLSIGYIVGAITHPLDSLIQVIRSLQEAKISYDRVDEIYKQQDEGASSTPLLTHLPQQDIVFDDVSFRYEGSSSHFVLKDISLTVPQNKITAIVGASGSGKTTLLKLLLNFYPPTRGEIYFGRHNFNTIHPQSWRNKCGVVMQDGYIFSGTIADNISMQDGDWDMEKLEQAARIASIDEFIGELPLAYNTRIGNTGMDLSGGQRQRILIARAVYNDPDFIFFDEATSSLDAGNERQIINNLHTFLKNKTVVIIAHRLSTVRDAHQIIVLENGRIVEYGNHESLVKERNKYFWLVKNQLELGA